MSGAVVSIHARRLLTKAELAEIIGRSPRWIELRQRDGLPVEDTDRYGRRLYKLEAVHAWMHERQRPRSTADRLTDLEREVRELRALVNEMGGER